MKTPSLPPLLVRRLEPLIEAERTIQGFKFLVAALLLGVALKAGLMGLDRWAGLPARQMLFVTLGVYGGFVAMLLVGWFRIMRQPVSMHELALGLERDHPELQATLLTALQRPEEGKLSRYLHDRVINEAVRHGISHDWMGNSRRRRVILWKTLGMFTALGLLALQVWMLLPASRRAPAVAAVESTPVLPVPANLEVEIRPGAVEVERGGRLVVEARFKGGIPESATLVLSSDAEGKNETSRMPMKAAVDASTYGGVLAKVDQDAFYRVIYGEQSSPAYPITTYVHPELVQSDAIITPPAYSGQPVKEVKKTQNVTALEGSKVKFRIKVNKPVTEAELYGEDKSSLALVVAKDDPLTLEGTMEPSQTQKYRLHLVDAQERSNKQPPWFKVNIISDQPPKVEIVFPKRDLAVSPIQEMPLEAKVWDDLGVKQAGAVFMLGDQTREVPLTTGALEGKKHHELKTMMAMEQLKASPRQLLSYYVWAEDTAPGGEIRRTQSDMFFAEVRHFEDIFREGEAPPGGAGGGGGSPADKLGKLQKEVLNATWKVVREAGLGKKYEKLADDMSVLKESQAIARQQTEEALADVDDAEVKAALEDAEKAMAQAVQTLQQGIEQKDLQANNRALTPERAALEALFRAQSREHRVMRNQQSQSSSAGNQSSERQLMQLELKRQDKRYEEEKAATEEKTAEQQENLQVLARLKELARRQEALAEKIKELQAQLQQAKTEDQKEELEQQLKRLQEEQEQLLRDVDDLKERMEKPENQANMAQEREKLDEAREQAREAADQLAQQQPGSAASAATKAQENLEKVRDEFRERTSRRFADEVKQLKQQATDLATDQEKLAEAMKPEAAPGKEPKDTVADLQQRLQANQLARQVDGQRQALEKVMEQMRQLSEQSEQSEPLLSNALHDAMRRAHAAGIDDALAEARDQSQFGRSPEAQSSERKAAKGIDDLKQNVDKAAESVLGSETEALRMARSELDRLLQEAGKDVKQGESGPGGKETTASGGAVASADPLKPDKPNPNGAPGDPPTGDKNAQGAKMVEGGQKGESQQGQKPGESKQPGQEGQQLSQDVAMGQGQQPGQGQMAGNSPSSGQGERPSPAAADRNSTPGPSQGGGQGRGASGQLAQGTSSGGEGGSNRSSMGGNGGGPDGGWFFDQPAELTNDSAITGANYEGWADRLRRVEEALSTPELREQAARVQDNARNLRVDARRNDLPPQSDKVQMQIVQPLAELRDRVMEELAKRESTNPLTPLDRDPVPHRFREQVRRYYTELGGGN